MSIELIKNPISNFTPPTVGDSIPREDKVEDRVSAIALPALELAVSPGKSPRKSPRRSPAPFSLQQLNMNRPFSITTVNHPLSLEGMVVIVREPEAGSPYSGDASVDLTPSSSDCEEDSSEEEDSFRKSSNPFSIPLLALGPSMLSLSISTLSNGESSSQGSLTYSDEERSVSFREELGNFY